MSPKEEAQNSAQRRGFMATKTDGISEDRKALKTSKRIPHCERNNGLAIVTKCYLALTVLQLLDKIMDGTS